MKKRDEAHFRSNSKKKPTDFEHALQQSPTLTQLIHLINESNARLECIKALLPFTLHQGVRAGPIDEEGWTLLVNSTAIAAKLRQLTPKLIEHLKNKNLKVASIRLKIISQSHF